MPLVEITQNKLQEKAPFLQTKHPAAEDNPPAKPLYLQTTLRPWHLSALHD